MKKHGVVIVLIFAFSLLMVAFAGAGTAPAEDLPGYDEAYGAAMGGALYNTQVIIGITADAFAKDVYNKDEAKDIITEQKSLIGVHDNYIGKLLKKASVTKEDKESLNSMSACIAKLNVTADALLAYFVNPTESNADDFQTKRKASYAAIEKLLGINQEKK